MLSRLKLGLLQSYRPHKFLQNVGCCILVYISVGQVAQCFKDVFGILHAFETSKVHG